MIAGVLYAIGFGMIGTIKTFLLFILSTMIWTIGEILVVTNFNVYIANNSPQNFRGRFSSIGSLSWATGSALGTSLAGRYIERMGINSIWSFICIICIIATTFMFFLYIYTLNKSSKLIKDTVSK